VSHSLGKLAWKKPSRSNANTACVEVASDYGQVLIRDSKQTDTVGYPVLLVDQCEWMAVVNLSR